MIIILMGVSGAGKSTVGKLLAEQVGFVYCDADDFHTDTNKRKMAAGVPLNDADRLPWLSAVRGFMDDSAARGRDVVLSCSALKARYRKALITDKATVVFVYLKGDHALIEHRLSARANHFVGTELLSSQFETLEEPDDKEAMVVDVARTPQAIIDEIRARCKI